jgi:hypothetical protein
VKVPLPVAVFKAEDEEDVAEGLELLEVDAPITVPVKAAAATRYSPFVKSITKKEG